VTDTVKHLALSLPEDRLREWILEQRWFGSKSRELSSVQVIGAPVVCTDEPLLALAVVEVRFHAGTHELYHVPLGFRREWDEPICEVEGWFAYDALRDPELVEHLIERMRRQDEVAGGEAMLEFRWAGEGDGELGAVRPMGAEQSNTSLVIGGELVLKAYRRIEAGVNPELELLRFLTERGFPSIASLEGWAAYIGTPLEATLAIVQEYVPGEGDGWEVALDAIASGRGDEFVERLRALGETTGAMHSVLASSSTDPAFAPEDPSVEALGLLTASVDEEIEELFVSLPERDDLEPILGRGEEVREQLRGLTHAGDVGKVIRAHGDYHLGQALLTDGGWVLLDFEGEPARPVVERRRKRSPLRDVAGMLRSFAYAASAASLERGVEPPEGWEARARDAFLLGYLDEVDHSLIPSGSSLERLLAVFELEKAVYELRYELDNRPEWVRIPVAGIVRLLERAAV
jgi:trehalose synthase-fused probable maltokinase